MPFNKKLYPDNWPEISRIIRARAQDACEFCQAQNHEPHPITGSKVVLTVAHLDHTPSNCDPANLRALCQRCHLRYDAQHHAQTAAQTRQNRVIAADKLPNNLSRSRYDRKQVHE
jgi:5-methylcytosine-specific restriction endonuclease McrA